jgi:hypothetical protein
VGKLKFRGLVLRNLKFILLIATFFSLVGSQEALARRGFRFFSIPTGETIVLVKDLPNIPELRRPDGTYVDLGYHFRSFSKGEWVGYIGSSSSFLNFTETELQLLLKFGRLNKLPPVPPRPPTSELATYFLYFLIAAGAFGLFKKFASGGMRKRSEPEYAPVQKRQDDMALEPSPALLAKMMEAASKHQQSLANGTYRPQTFKSKPNGPVAFGKRS